MASGPSQINLTTGGQQLASQMGQWETFIFPQWVPGSIHHGDHTVMATSRPQPSWLPDLGATVPVKFGSQTTKLSTFCTSKSFNGTMMA